MSKPSPVKDADSLAQSGYEAAPLVPKAEEKKADPKPFAGGRDAQVEWMNARDKALLEGDESDPVFQISFERESIGPPAAKVRAKDRANAWDKYCRQMGGEAFRTEHQPIITAA